MKNKLPQSFKIWESFFILSLILSLMLFMGLLVYAHTGPNTGAEGKIGRLLSSVFFYLFGYIAYLMPVIFSYAAWLFLRSRTKTDHESAEALWKLAGFLMSLVATCSLAAIAFPAIDHTGDNAGGGIIGAASALSLMTAFSPIGGMIFSLGLLLCGITLLTGLSWFAVSDTLGGATLAIMKKIQYLFNKWKNSLKNRKTPIKNVTPKTFAKIPVMSSVFSVSSVSEEIPVLAQTISPSMPVHAHINTNSLPLVLSDLLDLLDLPVVQSEKAYSAEALLAMSKEVENKLKDFGIVVQVVAAHPGPVVTRFEIQLAPGIKASRITTLAKDLARSLSMVSVRVVEIIPGKSFVGLELPNQHRETVRLREVLSASVYQEARSPLSLALGKDIAGHPVVVDLAKMPHLLVAGTTGSGKSVGLNAMLLSFLFKASPKEMRMIMIDPKMLELSIYEGIPHLLTPVVTDMKEAANALRWCIGEMERRYRLMAALGVRNLAGFNLKIQEAIEKGEALLDPLCSTQIPDTGSAPSLLTPLPYIVVIIDEFADMIMVVGKKVEELIARIAQKARAAGIHLILATQRPSVDVITGLIKANIPTRIAFQVSSKIDSRTILDQQGAEQLLGHGDMLYLAPGTGVPVRVHGAFVADHEVHKVVEFLKLQGAPEYLDSVLTEQSSYVSGLLSNENAENHPANLSDESDPLYDEAVNIVLETRKASISSVQRRLRIGYNRAARLLETMESAGLVSALTTGGTREVLIPKRTD